MFDLLFRKKIKQQQVDDLYREIVKSFPGVKEDGIKIKYKFFNWMITAGYFSLNAEGTKKEPQITVGPRFFKLSKEEQKGGLAHEIGHHEVRKNHSIERLKRMRYWSGMCNGYFKIPSNLPHWKERLKKWRILSEMAADNHAANVGYGKNLMGYYKNRLLSSNEIGQKLIANLEEKLRSA